MAVDLRVGKVSCVSSAFQGGQSCRKRHGIQRRVEKAQVVKRSVKGTSETLSIIRIHNVNLGRGSLAR